MNKTWTINELRNAIVNSESINRYYNSDDSAFDTITDTQTKELSAESWCKCDEICNYISNLNDEIYASNLGRIKIKKDGKDFICPLYDKQDIENPINKEVFANLLAKRKAVGYLIIKNPITNEFLKLKSKNNDDYLCVYHLVADAWLEKDTKKTIVHHITDDGYDNRPENLIWVSSDEHNQIHFGKKDDHYHPGKYDK